MHAQFSYKQKIKDYMQNLFHILYTYLIDWVLAFTVLLYSYLIDWVFTFTVLLCSYLIGCSPSQYYYIPN